MLTSPTPHLCGFAATVFIWCLFARLVCDRLSFKQTCSCCGVIKDTLAQSQEIFCCDACGFEADRDINAAHNLDSY